MNQKIQKSSREIGTRQVRDVEEPGQREGADPPGELPDLPRLSRTQTCRCQVKDMRLANKENRPAKAQIPAKSTAGQKKASTASSAAPVVAASTAQGGRDSKTDKSAAVARAVGGEGRHDQPQATK